MIAANKSTVYIDHVAPTKDLSAFSDKVTVILWGNAQEILGYADGSLTDDEMIAAFGYAISMDPFARTCLRCFTMSGTGTARESIVSWNDPCLLSVMEEVGYSRWAAYEATLDPAWRASLDTLAQIADSATRERAMLEHGPISLRPTCRYLAVACDYLDVVRKAHARHPDSVHLRNLYDQALNELGELVAASPKGYQVGLYLKDRT